MMKAIILAAAVLVSGPEPGSKTLVYAYCKPGMATELARRAIRSDDDSVYERVFTDPGIPCYDARLTGGPLTMVEVVRRVFTDGCLDFWLLRDADGSEAVSWTTRENCEEGGI